MVKEVILNGRKIQVDYSKVENKDGLHHILIRFKVTSEDYHDISVLLYEGIFDVSIPEEDLNFRGKIYHYSTSITNLYEENQVSDYQLGLVEVK